MIARTTLSLHLRGILRLALVLLLFSRFLPAANPAVAVDVTQTVVFTTQGQSLFGTGPSAFPPDPKHTTLNIFDSGDQNFNVPLFVDPLTGSNFKLNATANAKLKLELESNVSSGALDATVPVNVKLSVPTFNDLTDGIFDVGFAQAFTVDRDAAIVHSTTPTLQFGADLALEARTTMKTNVKVVTPWQTYSDEREFSPFEFPDDRTDAEKAAGTPSPADQRLKLELVAFNRNINDINDPNNGKPDGQVRLLPLFGLLKKSLAVKKLGDDLKEAGKAKTEAERRAKKTEVVVKSLKFEVGEPIFEGVEFKLPFIELNGNDAVFDPPPMNALRPNAFSASGRDTVATLKFDVDAALTKFLPPPVPPLGTAFSFDFVGGSVSANASLLDVNFEPSLDLTQKATVEAKSMQVTFNFGRDANVQIIGSDNVAVDALSKRPTATLQPGQRLHFVEDMIDDVDGNKTFKDGNINLQPTYKLGADLKSEFGVGLSAAVVIKVLEAGFSGDLLGIDLPSAKVGPVWEKNIPVGNLDLFNFFAPPAWKLDGFDDVTSGTIVLSTKGQDWTGGGGNQSFFTAGNWSNGVAPTGEDLTISSTNAVNIPVDMPNGMVRTLTILPQATLVVQSTRTLTVSGNLNINPGGNQVGLRIAENAVVDLTRPVETRLSGNGSVRLEGANLPATAPKLQTANSLRMLGGFIEGRGKLTVGQNLFIDGGKLTANDAGGPLEVTANTVQHVDGGQAPGQFRATGGATLALNVSGATGIAGGAGDFRLEFLAENNSTLDINSPIIDSSRFMTAGTGKIRLGVSAELSNIVNNANVETINNAALTFAQGTVTNTGVIKVAPNSSVKLKAGASVTFTGPGKLDLAGTTLSGGIGLVNDANHTIQLSAAGASLGGSVAVDRPLITNAGVIEATANAEIAPVTNGSITFKNETGVVRGLGATLSIVSGKTSNLSLFEAGKRTVAPNGAVTAQAGHIVMGPDAVLEQLSTNGTDTTLTAGTYRLAEGTSTMSIRNGPTIQNFKNGAVIELYGTPAGNASNFSVNGTDLANVASFENLAGAQLTLGPGRSFDTANLINSGVITLQGGSPKSVGKINNLASGVVQAVQPEPGANAASVIKLRVVSNASTNQGLITAFKQAGTAGSVSLTVLSGEDGDADEESFRNDGTVYVSNAALNFSGYQINHNDSVDATIFEGGTWIVEGTEDAAPTTLALNLATLPTKMGANVMFVGDKSNITFNGTAFENTIDKLDSGVLTLAGRDMTFAKPLQNSAQLLLSDSEVKIGATGAGTLTNDGAIVGFGSIEAGAITNSGALVASEGGLVIIGASVDNTMGVVNAATYNVTADTAAGGIGILESEILHGTVTIGLDAALFGQGLVRVDTLTNQGSIVTAMAPDNKPLVIDDAAKVDNDGTITATSGNRLVLTGRGDVLDNAGAGPANPGKLQIIPAAVNSGLPNARNGRMEINQLTVNQGELDVRGINKSQIFALDFGINPDNLLQNDAVVFGRNATLSEVVIDVHDSTLWADSPLQPFTLIPSTAPNARLTEAHIVGSTLLASGGAQMVLTGAPGSLGKFRLFDSDIVASGAGSKVELRGVSLTGGLLVNLGGGVIDMPVSNEFTNVNSEANLTVNLGTTLTVKKVFRNENFRALKTPVMVEADSEHVRGTLNVSGALLLDGTTAIGGGDATQGLLPVASGADFIGGTLNIQATGKVELNGKARILGADIVNNGAINVGPADDLTIIESADSKVANNEFTNKGKIDVRNTGVLTVMNPRLLNTGNVEVGGKVVAPIFEQTAGGTTTVEVGGQVDGAYELKGGTLKGGGQITGNLMQTGGTFEPGSSPGTFFLGDGYTLGGGSLHIEVTSTANDKVDALGGSVFLVAGSIVVDLTMVPDADPIFQQTTVGFDIFDVSSGNVIDLEGAQFVVPKRGHYTHQRFDENTGIFYLSVVPEPTSIALALVLATIGAVRRRPLGQN